MAVASCRSVSGRTNLHLLFGDVHDVQAGSLAHELHHQPQLIFVHERSIAAKHVRVVAHAHHCHLPQNNAKTTKNALDCECVAVILLFHRTGRAKQEYGSPSDVLYILRTQHTSKLLLVDHLIYGGFMGVGTRSS